MRMHLVCNAHLDPAWLWELDEGIAEALSTFRVAADFCERDAGFVFNHNESILYEWVREHDPTLFSRIQKLVAAGRWHIMGGWYLQPDCNMPCGESFVRQILEGRRFFERHFGTAPSTAINFDPFGHSRGLVQILAKSGYDSYIHCRPGPEWIDLPGRYYRWTGYDGSSVLVAYRPDSYHSLSGKAVEKIETALREESERECSLLLWGIGNHGGGPSSADLDGVNRFAARSAEEIIHSTPEAFFAELSDVRETLPEWTSDLNPWAPGCYTSQIRIKQKHRLLESLLYETERTAVHAQLVLGVAYPFEALTEARTDLLTAEFHDILPGSAIEAVEESSLELLDHGLEILRRARRTQVFAFARGLPQVSEGEIPLVLHNTSTHIRRDVFECEFQPAAQNWDDTFTDYEAFLGGVRLPSQIEHEASNITLDWRKKVVFSAELPASSIHQILLRPVVRSEQPRSGRVADGRDVEVSGSQFHAAVGTNDGLLRLATPEGRAVLRPGAFRLLAVRDNEDPWGSRVRSFRDVDGAFRLMTPERAGDYSGLGGAGLGAVRLIEDGPVRSVVESLFEYGDSAAILRYFLPKREPFFDVEVEIIWHEKNRMAKLSIPSAIQDAELMGEVAFGAEKLPKNGDELVTQRWQLIRSDTDERALAVLDDGVYGSDFAGGELRLSLVRSAVYSALPLEGRPLVSGDRHHPRIDQGRRTFRFRFVLGRRAELESRVSLLAQQFNEPVRVLSVFSSGEAAVHARGLEIDNPVVLCSALKRAEDADEADPQEWVLRLFNCAPSEEHARVGFPAVSLELSVALGAYEVKTYRFDTYGAVREVNLLER